MTMSKMLASALLSLTAATGFAQSNLGAACGCPTPVSSRPTVNVSTLTDNSGGAADGELLAPNTIFDCSKTWILDKKVYVPSGKTLIIQPGTVIKGNAAANPADATCLLVEVGGKIIASGTEDCQIVFTAAADNLDGSYPISNIGQWGGLLLAGKATNNLTLAANGPFQAGVGDGRLCVADGLGTFEGFASSNSKNQFGVNLTAGGVFDDNDNSGILRYVSIRHSGAVLQVGGEINGLTLGSVGRGTTIEHLEIVSCADDGIEFFGGTVNVKYCTMLFGNDDNFDWDDGWRGKAQFVFAVLSPSSSPDADHGMECDADDQKSNNTPRSHPVFYNATFIGKDKWVSTADNSGMSGIRAKEYTEGEIYNSIFANFRYGFNVSKTIPSGRTWEAYHNWSTAAGNGTNSLKVKCNTFANDTAAFRAMVLDNATTTPMTAADSTQFFTTDLNTSVSTIPGFLYNWAINPTTNAVTTQFDAIPNPALSVTGCPTPPVDGFFTPTSYRGAFAPTGDSWLSNWSYSTVLDVTAGLQPCPADINNDGIINVSDFNAVLGAFGTSCQ